MSPDAHVAMKVTTSLRFKTCGYVLQHGAPPRILEEHCAHGAYSTRVVPSGSFTWFNAIKTVTCL